MIDTGTMTDTLLLRLTGTPASLLIGDGVAPTAGGWGTGAPNVGTFTPYTVLAFEGAIPTNPEVARAEPDWETRWQLRHYAGSRDQGDWQALRARERVVSALQVIFGVNVQYKIAALRWNSLGAMQRNDTTDPPYWQASDVVVLSASRVNIRRT